MFKSLLGKVFRTRTTRAPQSAMLAEANGSAVQAGSAQPVSIFEDETYKVRKAYRVPPIKLQPSFETVAATLPPQSRQVEVPRPSKPELEQYRTVLNRPVPQQGFASFEHKVRELSSVAPDPRAAFLDSDANDVNAPAGYLPSYRFKILEVVDRHADTLIRKFRQLVVEDDYGTVDFAAWNKEADYFVDRVLRRELGADLFGLPDSLPRSIVSHRIIAWRCAPEAASTTAAFDHEMSGHDYEHYCADLLRAAGWTARVTKASGDQGVDVEAQKDGVRVVLQCKKYSAAVGNAAVQEVLAGKEFYGADIGVVVSNASFTAAAKQLARSTGIRLLHHDDLLSFRC
jgi:restriction system protein